MLESLGALSATISPRGVARLEFTSTVSGTPDPPPDDPETHELWQRLHSELAAYFGGSLRRFTVPLDLAGSEFQLRVWRELQRIPYGETRSYAELAQSIGQPRAVRAVGRANGSNPVAILVPCHRVIQRDGGLGGYAAGLDRKRVLLELERRA